MSINTRKSKVQLTQLAKLFSAGESFHTFLEDLPASLAVNDLRLLVDHIAAAHQNKKPVLMMMGAHVIKVGLNPLIVDLLRHRIVQGIAFNGACAIHDIELAYFGMTSEDVAEALKDGSFGMVEETANIINTTVQNGMKDNLGFGEALGKRIVEDQPPHRLITLLPGAI